MSHTWEQLFLQVQRWLRGADSSLKPEIPSSYSSHWELVLPQSDAEQEGGCKLAIYIWMIIVFLDNDVWWELCLIIESMCWKMKMRRKVQQKMCLCFLVKSSLFISLRCRWRWGSEQCLPWSPMTFNWKKWCEMCNWLFSDIISCKNGNHAR